MTTLGLRLALVATLAAAIPAASPSAAMVAASGQPPAQEPQSPLAQAVRSEIVRGAGAAERAFYAARGYAPLWLAQDGSATSAAAALLDWAGRADAQALPPARYDTESLRKELGAAQGPAGRAELELGLTRLYLTYARDLSSGLLEPRDVSPELDVTPPRPDPAHLLGQAAEASDMPAFLSSLAPADPEYRRLLDLYGKIRQIARAGGWGPTVPDGPTLRLGDRSPRVAQLRARLTAMGDLRKVDRVAASNVMNDAAPADRDPERHGAALEAAIKRFQARHGLNTDGAVGPNTLAAINTTAETRARQVAINLERLRWLNRDMRQRHILINLAGFRMSLIEDGQTRFSTQTIVGQAKDHRTPEFNDQLEYIVVNPNWNVPRSIATKEILPELRKDPTYLEQNNMELIGADEPATMIDWNAVTPSSFAWRIRQLPGPDNALGAVKFLFPNSHSIYMHDTPAHRLFRYDRRDFSHGCIRLEHPVSFAHLLLSYQSSDPAALFDRLRAKPGEHWVRLERPIPVYVTYRTAWVEPDGTWQFRADVYQRDELVAAALRAAGVQLVGS